MSEMNLKKLATDNNWLKDFKLIIDPIILKFQLYQQSCSGVVLGHKRYNSYEDYLDQFNKLFSYKNGGFLRVPRFSVGKFYYDNDNNIMLEDTYSKLVKLYCEIEREIDRNIQKSDNEYQFVLKFYNENGYFPISFWNYLDDKSDISNSKYFNNSLKDLDNKYS